MIGIFDRTLKVAALSLHNVIGIFEWTLKVAALSLRFYLFVQFVAGING
jgi:hypothetical protein